MNLLTHADLRHDRLNPLSSNKLSASSFVFLIEKEQLQYNHIYHLRADQLYLFHNSVGFFNTTSHLSLNDLQGSFLNLQRECLNLSCYTNQNFYPHFLFPLIVFSFLEQASLILTSSLLDSLLQQAYSFDPSFSPIFFLQLAYRLSYAILGHNYEEERGKLSIEEIKQRCIIEDYWDSYCEIYPEKRVDFEAHITGRGNINQKVVCFQEDDNIVFILKENKADGYFRKGIYGDTFGDGTLESYKKEGRNNAFHKIIKEEGSENFCFFYKKKLSLNKNHPYYLCDYTLNVNKECLAIHFIGNSLERMYGKNEPIGIMPKKLTPLLLRSLKEGVKNIELSFENDKTFKETLDNIALKLKEYSITFEKMTSSFNKTLYYLKEANTRINSIRNLEDVNESINHSAIEYSHNKQLWHNDMTFLTIVFSFRSFIQKNLFYEFNSNKECLIKRKIFIEKERLDEHYICQEQLPFLKKDSSETNDILSVLYESAEERVSFPDYDFYATVTQLRKNRD